MTNNQLILSELINTIMHSHYLHVLSIEKNRTKPTTIQIETIQIVTRNEDLSNKKVNVTHSTPEP